ncbi:MAG: purine-binding chemotaxis protein CheW [Verrucomicrobia bacterium]|nr:purine-binding chemotaxis protein CheW [Verrucomicrobiota bacterium]
MVFLIFQLGQDRYVIETSRVAEVLPCVKLKAIPQAAAGVAGVFNYHGAPVPVVDLSALALQRPARDSLTTRLLLVHYPTSDNRQRLLGLLAEQAIETVRLDKSAFQEPGVSSSGARYLGLVATDARGILQWVTLDKLLPAEVREHLWRQADETA